MAVSDFENSPGVTRRAFLGSAAALSCVAATVGVAAQRARHPFFSAHHLPVGLQLYTLGDAPYQDLEGTLKAVAAIGYRTVEGVGFMKHSASEFRAALDHAGLLCPSTHVELDPDLSGDLGKLAADLHRIGAQYAIVSLYPEPAQKDSEVTADQWRQVAAQLNVKGAALKREGLKLGVHNHNNDFVRYGSKTGYDLLLENTDPGLVWFEVDIGWVAAAGMDPIPLLRAHPGRFRLMHVKDLKRSTVPNTDYKMDPADVGSGYLDWKAIIPAGYDAGVRYYYVEQEPPFAVPRIEAARTDYGYLARL